jgi:hypothetical protein
MTMFYDNAPADLVKEMYTWLDVNSASERKPGMTDEQFYYKARKNAIGAFKAKMYALPQKEREKLSVAWEAQFEKLFKLLGMKDTRRFVDQYVKPAPVAPDMKFYLGEVAEVKMADDLAD